MKQEKVNEDVKMDIGDDHWLKDSFQSGIQVCKPELKSEPVLDIESEDCYVSESSEEIVDYVDKENTDNEESETEVASKGHNGKFKDTEEKEGTTGDLRIPWKKYQRTKSHLNNVNETSKHKKKTCEDQMKQVNKRASLKAKRVEGNHGQKPDESKNSAKFNAVMKNAVVSEVAKTGMCEFACPECRSNFNYWKKFVFHVKSKHRRTIGISDYKDYLSKATVHICNICSEKVLNEDRFLCLHFSWKHKMKLVDYRQKYCCNPDPSVIYQKMLKKGRKSENIIGNLCTFKCPGCRKTFRTSHALHTHANRSKQEHCSKAGSLGLARTYIEKVVTHNCKICDKLILCEKIWITFHLKCHGIKSLKKYAEMTGCILEVSKEDKIISKTMKCKQEVGNFCSYTCHSCSHVTKTWKNMRIHLKTNEHGPSVSTNWSDYISETVLHECVICQRKVLNEWAFLSNHFMRHHKTTSQYVKEYKLTHIKG